MCLDMDRKVEDVINDILFVVWISKIKKTYLLYMEASSCLGLLFQYEVFYSVFSKPLERE